MHYLSACLSNLRTKISWPLLPMRFGNSISLLPYKWWMVLLFLACLCNLVYSQKKQGPIAETYRTIICVIMQFFSARIFDREELQCSEFVLWFIFLLASARHVKRYWCSLLFFHALTPRMMQNFVSYRCYVITCMINLETSVYLNDCSASYLAIRHAFCVWR